MNRILVFVVILLVPIAIITSNDQEDDHIIEKDQGNISLEIPISSEENENKEETYQVMLSDNSDKSDAFAMDLEDYIIGVVAGEMPASFSLEALKAQAVASRTFALYKMESNKDYVLSTTINDQVYLTQDDMKNKWGNDYEYYYNRVKEAVLDTEGEVLTYNGKLASTYYFAISNGYTDDALTVFQEDRDYLVSVESPWDKDYQSYTSLYTMNKSDFCSKLEITCGDIQVSQVNRADNHYVREVTINGKTFTGIQVFQKLNLKSTDFTITSKGDTVEIQTLGFGHGVGMSQYGAQGMANDGYLYQDILKHYYQNTEITKL
ncbi:stage II sporulation protein D [Mycoplasma sp. CAG:776]|nr:stage II sporulation protein D [Mycoplasma sp. CAG:776]